MARLCRIHVMGVGKESARFNPLTIDLRNPQNDAPQDSVIWLRNGGGKTTLISIFYSLLVPNASHFLGKLNGKGATLEDFLRPDQLAVIATEWDLSAMGSPRRIVGQALLLKERKLIRKYFSFSEVRDFGFNNLPIHGLATPAKSLDKLDDALREAQRQHPSMDLLIVDETQWQWEEHLTNLGLDPGLFRAHLIMNSQEGGATEIFKIKTPEEFLRRFLELVYDEESTAEIETTLKLFRQKLAQNPSYRGAIEFGDALLKHLRPFAQDATRRRDLAQEQGKLNYEMTQLAASIEEHLVRLRSGIETLTTQVKECGNIAEGKDKERSRKERFARGYDKRARRLRVRETEYALTEAKRARAGHERRLRILTAAKGFTQARAAQAELNALLESLEELRREHRPELEGLRQLGSALVSSWERRLDNLQADRDLTGESIHEHEGSLDRLRAQRIELTERRTRAEQQRDQAQAAIRRYEEARRRLRDDVALNEGESGLEARARWQGEIERCTAQLTRLREEIAALKTRVLSTSAALTEIDAKCRAQEQERTELETKLGAEESKRHELEELPLLKELAEGTKPDLRNSFLLESLDRRGDEAQTELVRLGVEEADDKRDDQSLEREGLFAPSADVEEVLSRLKQANVSSALPLYRWLDEHCTPDEADELLRQHPAAYAGILVQTSTDLDRARKELATARIRAPIVLLPPAALPASSDGATAHHTIVPNERGMFSKSEAASTRPRIEQRRHDHSERRERAEERREKAHIAATRLRDYLRDFHVDRVAALRGALDSVVVTLTSLNAEKTRLTGERDDIQQRLSDAHDAQLRAQSEHGDAKRREAQLAAFVAEHEERIDHHRKSADYHQGIFCEAEAGLRRIEQQEPGIKSALTAARTQGEELRSAWEKAKAARDLVPEEYCGPAPATAETRSPEEVAPAFNAAHSAYEGKIHKGELDGAIGVQRRAAGQAEADYRKLRYDLPEDEIEEAADEEAIDVAIDRQRSIFDNAKTAETLADSEHRKAQVEAPDDRDFKEGEELDREREQQPDTSEEGRIVAQEYRDAAGVLRQEVDAAREQERIAATRLARQEKELPNYDNWSEQLPAASGALGHPAFTGVPDEDRQLVHDMLARQKTNADRLIRVERALTERFDKHIHPQIFHPDFDRFRIPFRDRLKLLQRDDFVAKADEQIQSVQTQVQICHNELNSEEQERRTIVDKLDAIARRATNLLGQAETVSTMPNSISPWAQQPFLRVSVPKKNDPIERQVLLRHAIERWFEAGEIPSGHKLAYECLLAVCGTKTISIRILKPEYHLSPVAREITELVKFSDGEKLTAAILLYCILVRLRARHKIRTEILLEKDSGMLLLDNPFGKATLAEFVDLQVRMARLMGVQLIYATGINDFAALKHFPHYVRLRNSARGKSSNDYHVTPDSRPLEGDQHVDGVVLGRNEDPARDGT
ncbi:MAG TPA: hypothetical protein VIS96_11490 [Terrimicrobiaceae bacterium]